MKKRSLITKLTLLYVGLDGLLILSYSTRVRSSRVNSSEL